jgi:hypothetical protein
LALNLAENLFWQMEKKFDGRYSERV